MIAAYAAASWAVFMRDLHIFLSYRLQAFGQAFSMIFSIALFYYMSRLLSIKGFDSPNSYFAFVVVGLVILAVTQSTLVLPLTLRGELLAGTFERILLSPFGAVRGAMSMMLFPLVSSLFMTVWVLSLAIVLFGLELHWSTVPLALPVGVLSGLAFSAVALIAAAAVVAFKQAPGVGFLIAAVSLVSGLYFPTRLLPPWIEWASEVQPFTPAVNLMRHLLVDLPMPEDWWVALLKLAGSSVVLLPIGAWLLARAVALGRRRGTILEY